MQYHHHPDGSIDFDFYRAKAKQLRSEAMQNGGRKLHQHGKTAAASLSAIFSQVLDALLDRMFPVQPPRRWTH